MIGLKGSFILGALASDGLLIASDSRGNLFKLVEDKQESILYFDGVKKIFYNNNLALAFTGQGVIEGYFLNFYLQDFLEKWNIDYFDPILSFFDFLKNNFKTHVLDSFKKQKIIGINYFENSPQITYWDSNINPKYSCITDGFIQSDKSNFNIQYDKSLDSTNLAKLIIESITDYSNYKENYLTINSEISILKITQNGADWMFYSEKNKDWLSYQDLRNDVLESRVPFQLIGDIKLENLNYLL